MTSDEREHNENMYRRKDEVENQLMEKKAVCRELKAQLKAEKQILGEKV